MSYLSWWAWTWRAGGSDPVTQRFLKKSGIDLLELYMLGAQMFADARQFKRAIDALKTIAALYPGNHIIHYDMGAMFYGYYSKNPSKKLLEEALECYGRSLEIKPDFIGATHDKILIPSGLQRPMDTFDACGEIPVKNPDDVFVLARGRRPKPTAGI